MPQSSQFWIDYQLVLLLTIALLQARVVLAIYIVQNTLFASKVIDSCTVLWKMYFRSHIYLCDKRANLWELFIRPEMWIMI